MSCKSLWDKNEANSSKLCNQFSFDLVRAPFFMVRDHTVCGIVQLLVQIKILQQHHIIKATIGV